MSCDSNCRHCRGLGYDASGMRCDCQAPARVTKVKRRIPAQKPTPTPRPRTNLRHLVKWMLIALIAMLMVALPLGVAYA